MTNLCNDQTCLLSTREGSHSQALNALFEQGCSLFPVELWNLRSPLTKPLRSRRPISPKVVPTTRTSAIDICSVIEQEETIGRKIDLFFCTSHRLRFLLASKTRRRLILGSASLHKNICCTYIKYHCRQVQEILIMPSCNPPL